MLVKVHPAVILYHTRNGHTLRLGEAVGAGLEAGGVGYELIDVCAPFAGWDALDSAPIIIFGSPTYFGGLSGVFKSFLDKTGPIWAEQRWSGKIAGGFTVSEWPSGDKLQTLVQMSLFAAQHGMHWATPGCSPPKSGGGGGCNRLGGWLGIMAQAGGQNGACELSDLDLQAAERLGIRAAALGLRVHGSMAGSGR